MRCQEGQQDDLISLLMLAEIQESFDMEPDNLPGSVAKAVFLNLDKFKTRRLQLHMP